MNFPFSMKKMYDETPYKIYDIANGDSLVGYGYEPLGGVVRIDDNDPRIVYSKGDWDVGSYSGHIHGLAHKATRIGSTATISYVGTNLVYVAHVGNFQSRRYANIYVDGVRTQTDLALTPSYAVESANQYSIALTSGLSFGFHTVIIEVSPLNGGYNFYINAFDILTTTNSSIKLAKDGIQNKSSALTLGNLNESTTDITQNIDEITQLLRNASLKRMSPTFSTVFQDNFNRADGAVENGWSAGTIASNKLSLPANSSTINGSPDWTDREVKFSFIAPSAGIEAYFKHKNGGNYIMFVISTGNSNNIFMYKSVGGATTASDYKSFTITAGTTYYVSLKSRGSIHTASITSNSDYVTGATTCICFESNVPTGNIKINTYANSEATLIDNVIVTAPVPYGAFVYSEFNSGACSSLVNNTFKTVNTLSNAVGGFTIGYPSTARELYSGFFPVIVGQSYTASVLRKLSAYTSGIGANIQIEWYQADKLTAVSSISGTAVTNIDANFTLQSVVGIAPANAAYGIVICYIIGVGICEWKTPLLELTSTATGVFHEKESRMDLVSLDTDGDIVVTKGTGESEIGYRVEQDGVISKFYRDSATIPHWDRAKVWTGGSGWINFATSIASSGNELYTLTTDDAFYISFVGTGIRWKMVTGASEVIAGVTVDNETEFLVDTYSSSSGSSFYDIKGLPYGQHQIKIRNTGTHNSLSTQYELDIDAFDIYVPKIPATPANCQPLGAVLKTDPDDGWIRYEETEGVVYSGTWTASSWKGDSKGTASFTATLNDYAEFAFIGTAVRWIGTKGQGYCISEVFTDEGAGYVSRGTVDEYGSPNVNQVILFSRTGMGLQLNKIKVVNTHTKNASSNDYYLEIDAFEVKQPLYTIDLRKKLPKQTKQYINTLLGDVYNLQTSAKDLAGAVNEVHAEGDAHKSNTVHVGARGSVDGSTSAPTTTSTNYVDMPDMSITITTKGGDVLLFFAGAFSNSAAGNAMYLQLKADSLGVGERHITAPIANYNFTMAGIQKVSGLAAGSHTFKAQWATSAGTLTGILTQRTLIAVEVGAPC